MQMNSASLDGLNTLITEQELLRTRTIYISEGVNSAVAKRVVSSLLLLEANGKGEPIYLYLNSPGGEVNSGFAIFDMIRFITSDVRIITCGLCASIATVIDVSVPKEKRFATPNSKFLIHQPLIGGTVRGQASDLEITAKDIVKTREKINQLLAKECGQELGRVEKDTQRDYWMSAEEALEYGLVSQIISSVNDIK